MTEEEKILRAVHSVLVVDWPSRDVPDTLARAGFEVIVHGGPGPEDYAAYECVDSEVVVRHRGVAPEHVDLVYTHRPLTELAGIITMARALQAKAIWIQSGLTPSGTKEPAGCWLPEEESRAARQLAEATGMTFLDKPYIADAVRQMGGGR